MLNPKIFVVVAVAAMAVVLASILVAGPAMVVDTPAGSGSNLQDQLFGGGDDNTQSTSTGAQILPLKVTLDNIELKKISDRSATLQVSFILHNPNQRSMIVQTLDYRLFEQEFYSDDGALAGGQIGSRPEGLVEFGSNYYTLLSESSITLRDSVTIANTGSTAFWNALESDTVSWHVTGDVFYNLSSMTSGQENSLSFEFTR